jgi:lysozyme family protein
MISAVGIATIGHGAKAQADLTKKFKRQLSSVMSRADALGLGSSEVGRAANQISRLDLASIVIKALETPNNRRAQELAKEAAGLLSDLNKRSKDSFAYPEARSSRPPFSALRADYRQKFEICETRSQYRKEVDQAASLILRPSAVERYVEVANITKVPWYVIGAIHYREASLNFLGHLHNGDRLDRLTHDVPAGRPRIRPWPPMPWDPRSSWRESAVDALTEFDGIPRWTVEWMLYGFESYNGMGYRGHSIASPYLWSYSQLYDHGGFYADGKFNPAWVSKQAGLAVIIKALSVKSSDVKPTFEA